MEHSNQNQGRQDFLNIFSSSVQFIHIFTFTKFHLFLSGVWWMTHLKEASELMLFMVDHSIGWKYRMVGNYWTCVGCGCNKFNKCVNVKCPNVRPQRFADVTLIFWDESYSQFWDNETLQQWKPFNVGIPPNLQHIFHAS